MRGLGHGDAFAAGAIAQDRGRAAQRERQRPGAGRSHGQRQYRLDLRGQLVVHQQRPAAMEGPARLLGHGAQGAPRRVQRLQERARQRLPRQVTGDAVRIQPQAAAVAGQQEVPAPLDGAGSDRFEQQWIARRGLPVQRQQVGVGRERKEMQHAGLWDGGRTR